MSTVNSVKENYGSSEIESLTELVSVLKEIETVEPSIASVRLVGKATLDRTNFKSALQANVDHIITV